MRCSVCGKDNGSHNAILYGEKKAVCTACKEQIKNLDVRERERGAGEYILAALNNSNDAAMKNYLLNAVNTPFFEGRGVEGGNIRNRVNFGATLFAESASTAIKPLTVHNEAAFDKKLRSPRLACLAFIGAIAAAALGLILGVLFAVLGQNFLFLAFSLLVGVGIGAGLYFLSRYLKIQHGIFYNSECQRNNSRKVIMLLEEIEKK